GLASHRQIEAAVAVRHDVEARGLLGIDDGGHGIEILLAEHRVAEGSLEGPAGQIRVVPERAGIGAGNGRRQDEVARHAQHSRSPYQSSREARRAPPARLPSLAQAMSGSTAARPTQVPTPPADHAIAVPL